MKDSLVTFTCVTDSRDVDHGSNQIAQGIALLQYP